MKRDKLPAICLEFGLMHVVLSSRLHHLRSRDKAAALVGLWAEIEAAAASPRSLRYLLAVKDQRGEPGHRRVPTPAGRGEPARPAPEHVPTPGHDPGPS